MSNVHRTPNFWVGLDVHKDSVTAAVFRNRDAEPMRVDRLPYDRKKWSCPGLVDTWDCALDFPRFRGQLGAAE